MPFIEMSGKTLLRLVTEGGPSPSGKGVATALAPSIVRVNHEGDIELRRRDRWDVIGGLLGEFEQRVKRETGLDWA